jgi:multiple sugar transport system permease protein
VATTVTGKSPGAPGRAPGRAGAPAAGRDASGATRLAALLLSPTFVVLALVVGYPVVAAFRQSLYIKGGELDAQGFVVEGDQFVGAQNYIDIFTGPKAAAFWNALYNTTFFTVVTVAIETVLGLAMALVMAQALRGRGLVRASILVPWAIPTAVSALLWKVIFENDGVANAIIGNQVLWSTDGFQAQLAVIIADTWKTAPFIGLLVLAGLQIIPREVYEAARVDGANAWERFWKITLPLVKPALLVAVLFRMLDVLRMFDLPYVLVGNNKQSVVTLSMVAYNEAANTNFGPAAAYSTVLFVYVAVIAYAFVKLLGADVIGDMRQKSGPSRRARRLALLRRQGVTA